MKSTKERKDSETMARKEKREVWRALKQLAFFAVCCLALLVVLPNSANAATEDEVTVIASGGSLSAAC